MNAAHLTEYVTIQRASIAKDAFGQEVKTWTPWTFVWAGIETLSGSAKMADRLVQSDASHRIRLWYIAGLLVTDRILWDDSRILDIVSIADPGQRHIELILLCKERTA